MRLRTRVLVSTVTGATLAVGGLGLLAEHSVAGTTGAVTTSSGTAPASSAPSAGSGRTSIVSGGS